MDTLLKVKNIDKYYKGKDGLFQTNKQVGALVDVSLEVNKGEIIALIGESGCGKTTLGKIVTGLVEPTAGEIFYNSKDIAKMTKTERNQFRREVQMVHQDSYAALNPSRTIFDSLKDPMIRHKVVKNKIEARKKLEELFELVGLTPVDQFMKKYPHQLSGGQRQRVLLTRALSVGPKLIIADEPVSMVDVSLRIALLDLMSKMNKEFGISFIYITHDLATARYIVKGGKIGVMYLGKMVELGELEKVLENPRHPYLQALLSAIPAVDIEISRKRRELPLKSVEMPNPANPPQGCRFNPRCIYAEDICEKKEPELVESRGRVIACHLEEKIPKWTY
ncbi:MAG: ABC transporter ATP-binding protein [Tissierella sp.]|nr:ABC transporter ATP-binding protein [Tissierella sp.]